MEMKLDVTCNLYVIKARKSKREQAVILSLVKHKGAMGILKWMENWSVFVSVLLKASEASKGKSW